MRLRTWMGVLLTALLLTGCFTFTIGTKDKPSSVELEGFANGYVSVDSLPDFDGDIFRLGVFKGTERPGEWVAVDLWPLLSAGVGFVGARVRILFFDIGVGALAYKPKAPHRVQMETTDTEESKPSETPPSEDSNSQ